MSTFGSAYLYMGIGLSVAFILVLFFVGYTKAPPDAAKIISGVHGLPRVLAGRAGWRIPFLERVDEIYLGQISVDAKTDAFIPAQDFINVRVDAIAKVRVKSGPGRNPACGEELLGQNAGFDSRRLAGKRARNHRHARL